MRTASDSPHRHIRFQERLGVGLLLAGAVAVVVGGYFFETTRRFYGSAAHASGRIIEVQEERNGTGNRTTRYPVFSFADASGVAHRVRSKVGYDPGGVAHDYQVGDSIQVVYPVDDPEAGRLDDWFSIWHWTALFGGGGLFLTVAGCWLWRGAVTWRRLAGRPGYS